MLDLESFYSDFGERVRDRRRELGLTQGELADTVDLNRTSITNIEKGRQWILLHTLGSLAIALRISPEALFPSLELRLEAGLEQDIEEQPPETRDWIKSALQQPEKEA